MQFEELVQVQKNIEGYRPWQNARTMKVVQSLTEQKKKLVIEEQKGVVGRILRFSVDNLSDNILVHVRESVPICDIRNDGKRVCGVQAVLCMY